MPVNNGFTYSLLTAFDNKELIKIESYSDSANIDMFISEVHDSSLHSKYVLDFHNSEIFTSMALSGYKNIAGDFSAYEVIL